jgi:hypothetical protein
MVPEEASLDYTLVITSADRFDLLQQSFESFLDNTDLKPSRVLIIEDGPAEQPEFLKRYRHFNIEWLNKDRRRGQVHSLDAVYSQVKTEYVYHAEDDFIHTATVPIRKSFEILEKHPLISLVALRTDWYHPIADGDQFSDQIKIAMPYWRKAWGGYTWNPGARRLSDIKKFGPVSKYGQQNGLEHEAMLSKAFLDAGYRIAVLPGQGCCHHIGGNRSKASEKVEIKEPKILVAVLACHSKQYGKWESEDSEHYDQRKAYNGKPYGRDIHISGDVDKGIDAVRATWWNEVKKQPTMTPKFFYGTGGIREPLEDEVFLSVPDDYEHLPHKTIAMVKYALENDYDYFFKCDSDSYLWPDRLLQEVTGSTWDYAGYLNGAVCSGGCGYWLSRKAMKAVQTNPDGWAEDVWVAKCMKYAGIESVMLPNHVPGFSNHWFDTSKVTSNMVCIHAVKPEDMRDLYQREHS